MILKMGEVCLPVDDGSQKEAFAWMKTGKMCLMDTFLRGQSMKTILFVVYTIRGSKGTDYRRIISARAADKDERELYESLKYEELNY